MPRFNSRLLIGIGIIFFGAAGFIVIIIIMARQFRPSPAPDEAGGGVGALPGIGEGRGGIVREGEEGGLPGGGGGEEGGTGGAGPIIPPPVQMDEVAQGGTTMVKRVIQGLTLNPTVTASGGMQYFDVEDDKFYRMNADGSGRRLLADEAFPGVVEVVWSPKEDSALLSFADGSNVYYDFTKRTMAVLPKNIVDPAFRADGGEIAYKFETTNADYNWLVVSSPDGQGMRAVQKTGENGEQVDVAWSPDHAIVAIFRQPRGIDREEIFFVGLKEENFISLDVKGSRFEGKWSSEGDLIMYSTVLAGNEYKPNVWLAEAGARGVGRQFNVGFATWVDRCAFGPPSSPLIYCAVPRTLPAGAGLAPQTARDAEYDLWSYDMKNGLSRFVAAPSLSQGQTLTGVRRLQASPDGSALFLETAGSVYRIRLK